EFLSRRQTVPTDPDGWDICRRTGPRLPLPPCFREAFGAIQEPGTFDNESRRSDECCEIHETDSWPTIEAVLWSVDHWRDAAESDGVGGVAAARHFEDQQSNPLDRVSAS